MEAGQSGAAVPGPARAIEHLDASDHDALTSATTATATEPAQVQTPAGTADSAMEPTPAPLNGTAAGSEKRTREQDADSEDEAIVHALLPASSSSSSKATSSTPAAAAASAPKPKPRARSRASDAGPAKKKRRSFAPGTPTAWCHQDHQPHDLNEEVLLHCSNRKPIGKPKSDATEPGPTKPCTIKYCEKCLKKQCVSRPFPCPVPRVLTTPTQLRRQRSRDGRIGPSRRLDLLRLSRRVQLHVVPPQTPRRDLDRGAVAVPSGRPL
jgi:hypothetical protein